MRNYAELTLLKGDVLYVIKKRAANCGSNAEVRHDYSLAYGTIIT